jgi:hypothetical protein
MIKVFFWHTFAQKFINFELKKIKINSCSPSSFNSTKLTQSIIAIDGSDGEEKSK